MFKKSRRSSSPSNGQTGALTSIYDVDDVDSLKVKIEVLQRKISQYEVR